MKQKVEGIVLRATAYGETHKILTLMTKELGKIAVVAHGAKKPKSKFSACSQIFTYGDFLIQSRVGMGTLHQGEVKESMRKIREDIVKTAYAACIIELTDKVVEDGSGSPYLYELLYKTLKYINEGKDADIMWYIFQLKMLVVIGIQPNLDDCQSCGTKEGWFSFSIVKAGFLCHECVDQDPHPIHISPTALKILRMLYHLDIVRLGNISVTSQTKEELRRVITNYYEEYSGLYLKSSLFLKQVHLLSEV